MNETNRNMILAIVLSVVVIFGWQFFVAGPQMERAQRQAQIAAEQAAAANPGLATTTTGTDTASTVEQFSDLVIQAVAGSATNLKVTYPADATVAEALLARRASA